MKRLALFLAALFAATLLSAAPAWAAPSNQPGGVAVQPPRALVPPCVTTTWRAQFWRMDKTRPGAVCVKADRATWIPKAWPRVGYVVVNGERRPVYLRTV